MRKKILTAVGLAIGLIFLFLIVLFVLKNFDTREVISKDENETNITVDGIKYVVEPSKLRAGGPPKGGIGIDKGIPALAEENIKFISVSEADGWIEDNELVLALIYKGVKKVYPLQILVFHEIANDEINGEPILITYCPLCGSGIAYERFVYTEEQKTETKFGTSGKLYNSNLVMYDEKTETYWTQIEGLAIVGKLTGQKLKAISIDTVTWRDWKKEHPDSQVLSQNTGFSRNYGKDPYGSYYEENFVWFPLENEDETFRIHPKTVIFGIEVNGKFKAYKESDLIKSGKIVDNFNRVNLEIERDNAGTVKIKNMETNEEIIKERDFWFSWYAFHPETELYGA